MSYNARISECQSRNYRDQSCLSQCTVCLAVVRYGSSLLPDPVTRDSLKLYMHNYIAAAMNTCVMRILFDSAYFVNNFVRVYFGIVRTTRSRSW